MTENGSVTQLISQLQGSDPMNRELAANDLWQRYSNSLLRVASQYISATVRRRFDEADITQDAFASFCLRHARGDFHLDSRNQFWNLLVRIIQRKAVNALEETTAQRRDIAMEQHSGSGDSSDSRASYQSLQISTDPGPVEVAIFRELFETHVLALPEELRQIVLMKLQGYTHNEIATKLNCSVRSVIRKLRRIQARFIAAMPSDENAHAADHGSNADAGD